MTPQSIGKKLDCLLDGFRQRKQLIIYEEIKVLCSLLYAKVDSRWMKHLNVENTKRFHGRKLFSLEVIFLVGPRIGKRTSKNSKQKPRKGKFNCIKMGREFCLTKDPMGKTNTYMTHGRQYLQCVNGQVINVH